MKAIVAFVSAAYGLAIALSLLIGLTGGHQSPLIALGYLSMILPAIAALIVSVSMNEPPRVQWDRFELKYLPAALFLMPIVLHAVMLPLSGVAWQDWLTPGPDGLYHAPDSRGWGELTASGVVEHIVINALVGLVVVSFLALFEEIGWRAWLLPRLRDRVGARRAIALTAIIWALWHVPFGLSGIQHIDGVSPLRLALTLPVGTLATGFILGCLWVRTQSVWLVAIAHGSLNSWGQYAFKYMKDSGTPTRDLAGLTAGSLAVLLVGTMLVWRLNESGDTAASYPSASNASRRGKSVSRDW